MKPWIFRMIAVAFVGLAGVVAVWQWSAPSGAWACTEIPMCETSVALDFGTLDLEGAWIGWQSFDLSPDGSEIVVALLSSEDPFRNDDRLLIGTFSTETGELLTAFVNERAVEFVGADEVRYSPDGSLVAAIWYQQRGRLQVFEAATGDLVSTVIEHEGQDTIGCSGALGISDTNGVVQCGASVFDIATGEVLETVDQARPWASKIGGSFASSTSGLSADGIGQREIVIVDEAGETSEPMAVVDPAPFANLDRSLVAFGETSDGTERLILLEDARAWRWSSRHPRRSSPGARLSVYSVETGQLEWSALLADRTSSVAVGGEGMVATISADGVVAIFGLE